jgi:hypothetical protein
MPISIYDIFLNHEIDHIFCGLGFIFEIKINISVHNLIFPENPIDCMKSKYSLTYSIIFEP